MYILNKALTKKLKKKLQNEVITTIINNNILTFIKSSKPVFADQ